MCPSGFHQAVAAALAGPVTDIPRLLVQRLSLTATLSVVEAIRFGD
jgi:hypothetical protein